MAISPNTLNTSKCPQQLQNVPTTPKRPQHTLKRLHTTKHTPPTTPNTTPARNTNATRILAGALSGRANYRPGSPERPVSRIHPYPSVAEGTPLSATDRIEEEIPHVKPNFIYLFIEFICTVY